MKKWVVSDELLLEAGEVGEGEDVLVVTTVQERLPLGLEVGGVDGGQVLADGLQKHCLVHLVGRHSLD